jgi:hypothetical protein
MSKTGHMSQASQIASEGIMSAGAPRQSTISNPPRQPYQRASPLLTWGSRSPRSGR